MRRNLLSPLLACVLLLGGITASMAQTTIVLQYTNQWSYLVTNALPPGGWTNVNYPAAQGWPVDPAPFAQDFEELMPSGVPPARTIIPLMYNNDTFVTSYYFRTTFTLPSNPTNLAIFGNAAVDDGAVFYVNGRRVQNLRMTTGAITHNTFALNDGGGDVVARPVDTFQIPSTNFVQGLNTIAVSVHQVNGTSSDIAFALELETEVIQPPVIITQPESQVVQAGRRATFEVEASGNFLTYRWYTNGVLIPGAASNTNSLVTPITTLAMDGTTYHVVVSNAVGRVQSVPVVLRVVPDTFGPEATLAFMTRSNWIDLKFDEPLNAAQMSSTNASRLTNFAVLILGTTERIPITNITVGAARTNVVLQLASVLGPPTNYVVCAYGVRDSSTNPPTGYATASTCVPLTFTNVFTIFEFGDIWRWNDSQWLLGNTPPTNLSATVDWKHINYPDTALPWREGVAPLSEDLQPPTINCTSGEGNILDRTPVTSYIRKRFTVNTNFPAGANLLIRHQLDDGAVFYLNGREIYRVNMPAGTPGYGTYATSGEGNCTSALLRGMATNVIRGQNIMAVELHQANESATVGHDTFFDVELNVAWPSFPIFPEIITTRTNIAGSGPGVRLTWGTNAPGWRLESSAEIAGPWTTVTTSTTNYTVPFSQGGPRRFYRLANP